MVVNYKSGGDSNSGSIEAEVVVVAKVAVIVILIYNQLKVLNLTLDFFHQLRRSFRARRMVHRMLT